MSEHSSKHPFFPCDCGADHCVQCGHPADDSDVHAQAEPKPVEIPEGIDHLLWDMKTWRSMPDATHNRQIVEAYNIGLSKARQRIKELEALRPEK